MANQEPQSDVLRVAVYGCGSMGQRYLNHFLDRDGKRTKFPGDYALYGIDHDPDTLTRLCLQKRIGDGVEFFSSFDECVSTVGEEHGAPIDMVFVCTPLEFHDEHLIEVSTNQIGRAVLIEKPLTATSGEPTAGHAVRNNLFDEVVSVGYNFRHHPFMNNLHNNRDLIQDLTFYVADDMKRWPGKSYGSPLYEYSHEIDMVACLTGSPYVGRVMMSNSQINVFGVHRTGNWRVRIRPYHKQRGRWIRVRLLDGTTLSYHWDVTSKVIEQTYRSQADELEQAWMDRMDGKDWSVRCGLPDGLKTSRLLHQAFTAMDSRSTAAADTYGAVH